jgi:hypothetical protein
MRPVSKKNIIKSKGNIGKSKKKVKVHENWNETIWKNEKDSKNEIKYIKEKFIKTSRFRVVTNTRVDDIIANLFLVDHPTKNIKREKNILRTPIKSKLYSISQIDKFGNQIKFIQNK